MRVIGADGYIGSAIGAPSAQGTLLVAGHSSVKMCKNDPEGAWVNNVEFFRAVFNNSPRPLLYASSGSVYEGDGVEDSPLSPRGIYDLTKITIDNIAKGADDVYGLRFATVCGYSPNLRVDVMLNKMVYDAITKKQVIVMNSTLPRPILGMKDLQRAINHIMDTRPPGGVYNLASFNSTVGEMAERVSKRFKVPILEAPGTSPYAMHISTEKFEKTGFEFKDTIDSIIDDLSRPWERTGVRV